MTSIRAWAYTAVALTAPFVALALGDASPMLISLPLVVALVLGVAADAGDSPRLSVAVDVEETLEGYPVEMRLKVAGRGGLAHVALDLPAATEMKEVEGARRVGRRGLSVPLRRGGGEAVVQLVSHRWGFQRLGGATVTVPGPLRMRLHRRTLPPTHTLVVLPGTEVARRLVEPIVKNMHTGDLVSDQRGAGLDLADLRPWIPGDPPRSLNWRATARSDAPWVTQRHADRNGDLVLVIDSIVRPQSEAAGVLTHVVRLAATLIDVYGNARHRLGLVSFGGFNRWFGLETGRVHHHRLLAALMLTQAQPEPVWTALDRVIERTVRPPSMVVFVSPLLDEAAVGRMARLSRMGLDVMAIEVDPTPWIETSADPIRSIARRIWDMERARTIDMLRATGVAVGKWKPGEALDQTMEEVEEWRRHFRRALM